MAVINITYVVMLIFDVLQIILFLKVWGMTSDIKEIRDEYLKDGDEKRG